MKVANWKAFEKKLENEARKFLMEAYGLELTVPVQVNGRLKSTYGRFVYYRSPKRPKLIEVGKNYIEHQDWKTIKETLIHECIHYALFVLGKPHNDGHPVFEAEIQKHGSHSTGTVAYRGKVVQYGCPKCKSVFSRKRRYPRNGAGYYCKKCKVDIVYLGEKFI
jgi:SprT-like protein